MADLKINVTKFTAFEKKSLLGFIDFEIVGKSKDSSTYLTNCKVIQGRESKFVTFAGRNYKNKKGENKTQYYYYNKSLNEKLSKFVNDNFDKIIENEGDGLPC